MLKRNCTSSRFGSISCFYLEDLFVTLVEYPGTNVNLWLEEIARCPPAKHVHAVGRLLVLVLWTNVDSGDRRFPTSFCWVQGRKKIFDFRPMLNNISCPTGKLWSAFEAIQRSANLSFSHMQANRFVRTFPPLMTTCGSTTLPADLDIFFPSSSMAKPWTSIDLQKESVRYNHSSGEKVSPLFESVIFWVGYCGRGRVQTKMIDINSILIRAPNFHFAYLYGACSLTATLVSSDDWNQPPNWSIPSKYRSAISSEILFT